MSTPPEMTSLDWWLSTFFFLAFGSIGAFCAAKEFNDPTFSDWITPGPGYYFSGDAGRIHELESAIQAALVGFPIDRAEAVSLALGTVGVALSPFRHNLCQFFTCALVPLQAWYFLLNIVYMPLTGAWEVAIGSMIIGVGLQVLCLWRLTSSFIYKAPSSSRLLLRLYGFYGIIAMTIAAIMVYRAADLEDEIAFLAHVRDYFWNHNGMTWTKGNDAPDGYDEYIQGLMADAGIDLSTAESSD